MMAFFTTHSPLTWVASAPTRKVPDGCPKRTALRSTPPAVSDVLQNLVVVGAGVLVDVGAHGCSPKWVGGQSSGSRLLEADLRCLPWNRDPLWEGGLPPMTVGQSMNVSTGIPLSGASPLPQGIGVGF